MWQHSRERWGHKPSDASGHQKLKEARDKFSPAPSEGARHAHTLISDFWPPGCGGTRVCGFKLPNVCEFDTAALEMSAVSEGCVRSATETWALRGRHLVTPLAAHGKSLGHVRSITEFTDGCLPASPFLSPFYSLSLPFFCPQWNITTCVSSPGVGFSPSLNC